MDDDNPYRSPRDVEGPSTDVPKRPDLTFAELKRLTLVLLWAMPVVALPWLAWALFEFQRMPYRPPEDMSTFLGKGEREAVWVMIVLVTVVWLAFVLYTPFRYLMRGSSRRRPPT